MRKTVVNNSTSKFPLKTLKIEENKSSHAEVGTSEIGKGKKSLKQKNNTISSSGNNDSHKNEEDKKEILDSKTKSKIMPSMGLIFLCSSKTKKDCFRYNIFGLPASKKDLVAKIYKGMRLFLFDTDSRMMYGVFKATEPGGYNVVPHAFKAAFPSQVRFRVLDDCPPLPEEIFRAAIRDNYYSRNKFRCELTSQQVKKLRRLFSRKSDRHKVPLGRIENFDRRVVHEVPYESFRVDRDPRRSPSPYRQRVHMSPPRTHYSPLPHDYDTIPPPQIVSRHSYGNEMLRVPPPLTHTYERPVYAIERPIDYYRRRETLLEPSSYPLEAPRELRPRDDILYRSSSLYRENPIYHERPLLSTIPSAYLPPSSAFRY